MDEDDDYEDDYEDDAYYDEDDEDYVVCGICEALHQERD